MFEVLNTNAQTLRVYPDSGPGPKVMRVGDMTDGYFGPVSTSEFNLTDLLTAELMHRGVYDLINTDNVRSIVWHKFAVDGDVVYYPQRSLFTPAPYVELYKAGCLYWDAFDAVKLPHAWLGPFVSQEAVLNVREGGVNHMLGIRGPKQVHDASGAVLQAQHAQFEYNRTIKRLVKHATGIRYGNLEYADITASYRGQTGVTANVGPRTIHQPSASPLTTPGYAGVSNSANLSAYTHLYHVGQTSYSPVLVLANRVNVESSYTIARGSSDADPHVGEYVDDLYSVTADKGVSVYPVGFDHSSEGLTETGIGDDVAQAIIPGGGFKSLGFVSESANETTTTDGKLGAVVVPGLFHSTERGNETITTKNSDPLFVQTTSEFVDQNISKPHALIASLDTSVTGFGLTGTSVISEVASVSQKLDGGFRTETLLGLEI